VRQKLATRREVLHRLGALGAGSLLSGASQPIPSGPITPATVTVTNTVAGVVGPGFAGLSYEKSQMTNPFFSPQNANAIGLFKLIGPSLLRIGGFSADEMTWTPNGAGRTPGQVAPSDIDALSGFLKAAGWQVLYGTNLAQSTPPLTAAEIAYAVKSLGSSLYGIEIGNEPDLYPGKYFPSTWGFPDYYTLWQSFAAAIRAQSPGVPLTGPTVAWEVGSFVAPFAEAEGTNVSLLTSHYYRGNGNAAFATAEFLVSPDAGIVKQCQAMLAIGQSVAVPYRIAETNSFWNPGAPNVEDSYASALWVIDHLFACASNGSQGINLHGGGQANHTPIADSNGVVVEPRPEFYGVIFFTLAGSGTVLETTIDVNSLNATAYAIEAQNGAYSVIVNNKDQTQTLHVTLILPQSAQSAQLIQLTGPALDAATGITIQGATIQPTGAFPLGVPIALSSPSFYVSPTSAVLVKIAPQSSSWTIAGSVAPESIATAYGTSLASSVSIQDSSGVTTTATIYFTSPTQIDFLIPSSVNIGPAIVTIGTQTAAVQITAVAPSLYLQNTSGLAAAYALVNGAYRPVTSPIDISSGEVYLILFGTGIRGAGSNVTATIGGVEASVTYAGPQGGIAGLDQVNVLIPAQLAGSGTVNVVLTADYLPANTAKVTIQ
jgi:uncharacterized protein (TIGR03437 family)